MAGAVVLWIWRGMEGGTLEARAIGSGAEEAECMNALVCGDGEEMWLGM